MIDAREVPVFGAWLAIVVDLLQFGGELVPAIAIFVIETVDLWIPFLSRLMELSGVFEWIPEGAIESLLMWFTVVFVVYYGLRLARRFYETL